MGTKPVPVPTPETQPFWDGAASGVLRIQRCVPCDSAYFYPRPFCPDCGTDEVEWFDASGRATLDSYIINERPAPGFTAPYVIATVILEEGPRMMTNIVNVVPNPENLELDMDLSVLFEQRADIAVPVFAPTESAEL